MDLGLIKGDFATKEILRKDRAQGPARERETQLKPISDKPEISVEEACRNGAVEVKNLLKRSFPAVNTERSEFKLCAGGGVKGDLINLIF